MEKVRHWAEYLNALVKWVLVGGIVGFFGGVIGSLFHLGVEHATHFRTTHPYVLYLLPVAGLLIAWLYRVCRLEGKSTNAVIESVHFGKDVPVLLLPAIFLSTVLTHLCGGSAGREGAALQIGGAIGHTTGRVLKLGEKDLPLATLCGMAGLFSALFGTPLTAVVFALEVISVGVFYYAGLVPCLTASLVGYLVSLGFGVAPTRFAVSAPLMSVQTILQVAGLGVGCAVVSILFCRGLHYIEHGIAKVLPNVYLRAAVGGLVIIGMTLLFGTAYNGAGMETINAALSGNAPTWGWLLKLLFTAVTIGCGFKGGEVVPSFFIGATFGCVAGPLLGLEAGFGAAVGMVAVFCGAVNCPMASVFLAIECFATDQVWYFAVACAISYLLSGYSGLYSSQTILYSKLHAEFINIHTR